VKRRDFIMLLGGAVAAWPLSARAQQPKMLRVGYSGIMQRDPARCGVQTKFASHACRPQQSIGPAVRQACLGSAWQR
jgi:hypothetical protein